MPPFYLLTAKALRDRSEPKRLRSLAKTIQTPDGSLRPARPADSFDAREGLAPAVMLPAAAIEAHANDMIRRLPDHATITVERAGVDVTFDRDSMERGLNLAEKITLVGPMLTGGKSIKGPSPWEACRRVITLHSELLHTKSKAENDLDKQARSGCSCRARERQRPRTQPPTFALWSPIGSRSTSGQTLASRSRTSLCAPSRSKQI